MSNPQIDLVIFDCDGVILDSEIISAEMLIQELAKHRVEIDHKFVARNFLGRSYPVVFTLVREIFGVQLPESFEVEYRATLLEAFSRDLKAIPNVGDVALNLNVPYCVATSSSPERARRSLEIVGLSDVFGQNLFTASQVKNGKPAPDLPLFAADQMGVRPQNCLLIEDSFNGIRSGLAAKMHVLRFTGASHISHPLDPEPDDAIPHFWVRSFDQFFDFWPQLSNVNKT